MVGLVQGVVAVSHGMRGVGASFDGMYGSWQQIFQHPFAYLARSIFGLIIRMFVHILDDLQLVYHVTPV